jgi:hypothetical protein
LEIFGKFNGVLPAPAIEAAPTGWKYVDDGRPPREQVGAIHPSDVDHRT